MKWLFYALCTVNIVALVFLWSDSRDLKRHERYVLGKDVLTLRMLNAGADLSNRCLLLGPFEDQTVVKTLEAVITREGYALDVVDQELELAPAYWVYFSDYKEGISPSQQLKEFKVKGLDAFVIGKGDLAGNISLGVFKNVDSARRMRKIAEKKGYATNLTEIKRENELYWLSVKSIYDAENKEKILGLLSELNLESEMRQIFCKSVASEK